MTSYCTWLPEVILIARHAGDAIMRVYDGEFDVERKQDDSPLTEADLAAHQVIANGLATLTPDLPVLSEEAADIPYATRRAWSRYWLVDPLDGTREFIKRNDEFSVNIALIDSGRPVLGVVYAPAKHLLYYACTGTGAFRQSADEAAKPMRARPLNPADIVVAGSRSHADSRQQRFLHNIAGKLSEPKLLSLGSSLKICLVAEGVADVYPRLGPTSEWDTAAAQCVLEEAGGNIEDHAQHALSYNSKDSLLNPDFFARGATPHNWSQYLE